ncbi:unnamed protein product (macronuclear) [Paramecium tetraurelia]|uniref:PX domain-containing protein n=1 Tax=Paramecium tetraurelia TaxID=5888 RepID=A0DV30_PARTE|nr:uncharacterized protein GSPATT00020559001 [Paramecium tetraurelia]CAK86897.1 unnamed protein product [Paramecium tetraurelia]|eukprot:XP_001454294.1 hypothetical protein (macronuclear) [Paramecium tetraurelia strain d4-2]
MKQQAQRYSVKIPKHDVIDKKVYYTISICNLEGGEPKEIRKRYSELESMHQKILEWIQIFKIKIPLIHFPKKKFLFHTNQCEESIIKRSGELQQYLNEILACPELHCLGVIEEMLPKELKPDAQKKNDKPVDRRWQEIQQIKESYLAKHGDSILSLPQKKVEQQSKQQYSFKFEDHFIFDDSALYTIQATDTITNKSWKFTQRFQDLRDYHRQLKSIQLDFPLPNFPEKKLVNICDAADLRGRKSQLEDYLNRIFSYQTVVESDIMVFFIAKSQLDGNEIGCRSKGTSQTTMDVIIKQYLKNSSIKSKSQTTIEQFDDDHKQPRKITC